MTALVTITTAIFRQDVFAIFFKPLLKDETVTFYFIYLNISGKGHKPLTSIYNVVFGVQISAAIRAIFPVHAKLSRPPSSWGVCSADASSRKRDRRDRKERIYWDSRTPPPPPGSRTAGVPASQHRPLTAPGPVDDVSQRVRPDPPGQSWPYIRTLQLRCRLTGSALLSSERNVYSDTS